MKYAAVIVAVGMALAALTPSSVHAADGPPSGASQGDLIKAIFDGYRSYLAMITTKLNEGDSTADTRPAANQAPADKGAKPATGSLQTGQLQTGTLQGAHLDGYPALPATGH